MRNYSFRKLTYQDLPTVHRWLQAAHVKVWWPDTDAQIALMEKDLDNGKIDMQLVCLIDRPFAYVHDHSAEAFVMPEFADLPKGARVMDTFVGDRDFLGQGHAAGYIDARLRDLRLRHPLVAVAPNTTDMRSIAVYTAAGFHKRRLASTRSGKLVQVMTHL